MPDNQPTFEPSDPVARADRVEEHVLDILLDADNHRPISIEELIREIGHDTNALDGLAGLCRAGLAHHLKTNTGEYAFATRAATHHHQIAG
jgi:Fe2+ or Zn2+ uptake regulation protein